MKNMVSLKNLSAAVMVGLVALVSCTKSSDTVLSATDTQNVNSESVSQSYTSETADIATSITGNIGDGVLGGTARAEALTFDVGALKKWDRRLACAKVTITRDQNSTKANPQGTITVYYDSTATCADTTGVQRKGTITIKYSGLRYFKGSTRVITFQDYSRNGIKIKGTYTLTNVTDTTSNSPLQIRHVIAGGQVIFTDGKTITRNQDITVEWDRGQTALTGSFKHLAGGTASGVTENNVGYQMTITADLVYSIPCILEKVIVPVSGTKTLLVGTNAYTIDYGTGTCDNMATVTHNGKSKVVTIGGDGN